MSAISFNYEEYTSLDNRKRAGAELQEWIDNPIGLCPIPKSTTTFENLQSQGCKILGDYFEDLPKRYHNQAFLPDFSPEKVYQFCSLLKREEEGIVWEWEGFIGPGVIFIEGVMKATQDVTPPMSEITQAVYQKDFSLSDLRGPAAAAGYTEVTTFEYNTKMYQALLATRIGKMVVYLVLGAFDRGTRRIARINVWFYERKLQMRFDIEVPA
ncbi:hypothetical protein PENDEC_c010G01285 [Penicillium decumbens]|uniref:Uncharacterized protein n=1 Tax=Penicillium decumbens TaxID=69771 RepID=A0A1V6PCA1_PENDC|nr:hypothetical protein PENDEC_c010G01285 [Penicillium decumbens]